MQTPTTTNPWLFVRHNPLVPAAALFLAGVTLATYLNVPVEIPLTASLATLVAWLVAEIMLTHQPCQWFAHITLSAALLCAGMCVWQLNQHHVETNHIVQFTDDAEPVPVAARMRVLTPPEPGSAHGNLYWIGSTTEIFTGNGWTPSTGDVQLKWRSGINTPELHRGQLVEVYGWFKRPDTALNPGAMNMRQFLVADRIFAEIRVPRAGGVVPLDDQSYRANPLTTLRLFLRSKLLEHTARIDVEAGYSMVALLLGHRDPVIENVSDAFADAGVSHLLAISGSHIVFFTALVWGILRFLPMRPRWRELAVAAIVLIYVLATPCGPPVVRAAVALLMLLIARLMGRPRMLMNMLAAAAIIVVLLRPADLLDAGFQLSFICTACLILLADRLYLTFSSNWLNRQRLIADLAGTRWAGLKFRAVRALRTLVFVNIVGTAAAAPLVAIHFGRVNPYAVITGLVALPVVGITMAASALELFLELVSTHLGALAAPLLTSIARAMVWIVTHLAALPGTAIAIRSPPAWIVALMYAIFILWALRRRLSLSRAHLVNIAAAIVTTTAAWYLLTQPIGGLSITVLSAGQGSSIVVRAPDGSIYLINAGSRDASNLVNRAIKPALRLAGVKQINGMLLTSLDTLSAQSAAEVVDRFHPPIVMTSATQWPNRTWTRAGATLEETITTHRIQHVDLAAGTLINIGNSTHLHILSPQPNDSQSTDGSLALLLEYSNRKILFLDPANLQTLAKLQITDENFHCDAIIFLGPQPAAANAALQKLAASTHAHSIIFSGRTPWTPRAKLPNQQNAADHAVTLRVNAAGDFTVE